jgi:hypothetical protein
MRRADAIRPLVDSQGAPVTRSYAEDILEASATILVKTGHSPKELRRIFGDISRTLEEPTRPFDPRSIPYVTGLSHIIAHWYSDPAYRGGDGQPLKIPLRGRGPCLADLIRRLFPGQDAAVVARSLVRINAIQRRGRLYFPTDRCVAFTRDLSSVHVHGLMSLAGILRTVQHNISSGDPKATLLERSAVNPRVPVRALPEIHRRIKREITAVLWKLDGYLRSWEVEPGTEATTRLGVGAYAFEDPIVTGLTAAARKPRKPPRRPQRPARASARRARRG